MPWKWNMIFVSVGSKVSSCGKLFVLWPVWKTWEPNYHSLGFMFLLAVIQTAFSFSKQRLFLCTNNLNYFCVFQDARNPQCLLISSYKPVVSCNWFCKAMKWFEYRILHHIGKLKCVGNRNLLFLVDFKISSNNSDSWNRLRRLPERAKLFPV